MRSLVLKLSARSCLLVAVGFAVLSTLSPPPVRANDEKLLEAFSELEEKRSKRAPPPFRQIPTSKALSDELLAFSELSLAVNASSNPSEALKHFHVARSKAPERLLPFIDFYEARSHLNTHNYAEALPLYRGLYRLKIWDAIWQDRILGDLFETLFKLDQHEDFLRLWQEFERRITRSPQLERVLLYGAEVFAKKARIAESLPLLEKAAQLYPISENSRTAFARLLDATCELAEGPAKTPYTFSLQVLRAMARNTAMDRGIREFILASAHSKLRIGTRPARYLDELEKVEYLFETRLYAEAFAEAKQLLANRSLSQEPRKIRELHLLLGRLANRLSLHREAARYFAMSPAHDLMSNELLADSLSYGGFPQSAGALYGELAQMTQRPLLRWHHFWSRYTGGDTKGALALLLTRRGSYVPPRDPDYPAGSSYWKARLLEKTARHTEARILYQDILATQGDDLYSNLIATRFPEIARVKPPETPTLALRATLAEPSPLLAEGAAFIGESTHKDLHFVERLTTAGLLEAARLVLGDVNLASLGPRELKAAFYLAHTSGSYTVLEEIARRLILATGVHFGNWYATIAHQEAFPNLWQTYYPIAFAEILLPIADELDVDPLLVLSVIRAESNYNEAALSYVGARGLMQIMPYTAIQIADRLHYEEFQFDALWDPIINVGFGAWYLKKLLTLYHNNSALAIAAYNAGPDAVNSWLGRCQGCDTDEFIETISFRETRKYVKDVLRHLSRYHRLYSRGQAFESLSVLPDKIPLGADLF